MKAPPPVHLVWRRSLLAAALIVVLYGATAALAIALPLPVAVRLAGAGGTGIACAWALRHTVGRRAPVRLSVGLDRRILVTTGDGAAHHGEILADSYVGPWLTTLVWRPDGARRPRTLIVLADTFTAGEFRQLRVVLRYGRAAAIGRETNGVDAA